MAGSDDLGIRQMLEQRLHALEEDLRHNLKAIRLVGAADADSADDGMAVHPEEDIGFAVVEMKARTAERIRRALARLETGEYGVCDSCGARIGPARLRVVPFASRCKACQEAFEEHHDRP